MNDKYCGILNTRKGDFRYRYKPIFSKEHGTIIYYFDIWQQGDNPDDYKNFSFLLKELPNGTDLKVIDLFANKYEGCGISIPIILKAKEIFAKRIISSSNNHKMHYSEANWQDAIDKVWLPMVSQGLAKYDDANDIFIVL